jgi:hypothetical protein
VDALLAKEQERRREPELRHAWAVFIGAPFAPPVPVEAEEAARDALLAGRLDDAVATLMAPMRARLEALAGRPEGEPAGDIYNAGAALSDEALQAFHAAKRTEREFRRLTVDPQRLHPDLHRKHFFSPGKVVLVAAFEGGKLAELFRYAGRAFFKGLEQSGGIGVWELLNEGPVYELLKRHHAVEWKSAGEAWREEVSSEEGPPPSR